MEGEDSHFKLTTAHNRIDVHRRGQRVELRSPGGALQSVLDLDRPARLQLANLEALMAIQLFVAAPRRVLLLGTAAGSLLHYLRGHHPRAHLTAVDIDAELVERMLALGYLPPADARLTYVYDDARHFIAHQRGEYDLLLVDVFSGAQSPRWLRERGTLQRLRGLLGADGAAGFNLLIGSEHDFRGFYRELRAVFDGKTLCLPVAGFENTIAYALRAAPPVRGMSEWLARAERLAGPLDLDLARILAVIYGTNPVGGGVL